MLDDKAMLKGLKYASRAYKSMPKGTLYFARASVATQPESLKVELSLEKADLPALRMAAKISCVGHQESVRVSRVANLAELRRAARPLGGPGAALGGPWALARLGLRLRVGPSGGGLSEGDAGLDGGPRPGRGRGRGRGCGLVVAQVRLAAATGPRRRRAQDAAVAQRRQPHMVCPHGLKLRLCEVYPHAQVIGN